MNRRQLLRTLAAVVTGVGLAPGRVAGMGPKSRLLIARARYRGGDWDAHPDALRRLVWEVTLRTSVEADYEFPVVRLSDGDLFRHPFLYLTGSQEFDPWTEDERRNLSRFVTLGGTVLVDDAAGRPASPFDRSFRREAAGLVSGSPLVRLADDHSIFRSYFLLRSVGGRVITSPFLEGIHVADRTPVIYCRNGLGAAWSRDSLGRWSYDCVPGGEAQRGAAFRLGVNSLLYALTVNYKQDQVHAPFIRRRMR